jgi:hypothetical protein
MTDYLPPFLAKILERELAPGERVIWKATPLPSARIRASWSKFLFGIPFFAFSVFWTWGATGGFGKPRPPTNSSPQWFPFLWGSMFMVVGASMLLTPLWYWWVARRTVYAITDRRAILIEVKLRRSIQSFMGERLVSVIRNEDSRGRGDIIFEREATKGSKGRTIYRDVGFFGLSDAKAVEQILHDVYAKDRPA